MTEQDIRAELKTWVRELGSQQAAAKRIGVSNPYFGDVLHGKRAPGPKVLRALGIEKSYRRQRKERP